MESGIEEANAQKTIDAVLFELEEMKKGNITELEFESSKGFIINSFNNSVIKSVYFFLIVYV